MADHVCKFCAKKVTTKAETGKLPMNWSRNPGTDEPVCPKCWNERWTCLTVTLPVAGPADPGSPEEAKDAVKGLRNRLKAGWHASTRLANWALHQLMAVDPPRTKTDTKMPPFPKVELYKLFQHYPDRDEWDGAASSANCVLRAVEKAYKNERFDALWHFVRTVRSVKWPAPFPVSHQTIKLEARPGGELIASVTLPGGRIDVRLRGGAEFRRQTSRIRELIDGGAVVGEAALYARPVGGNGADNRHGFRMYGPAGGMQYRVMFKVVGHFPRKPPELPAEPAEMLVRTSDESLVQVLQDGWDAWTFNGDDVRSRVYGAGRRRNRKKPGRLDDARHSGDAVRPRVLEHLGTQQRLREDVKAERRAPVEVSRQSHRAMTVDATRYQNWLRTRVDQLTAMLVGLAVRRKVSRIVYDDSARGFIPQFPYYQLKTKLEYKARERGLDFVQLNKEPKEGDEPPAASGETVNGSTGTTRMEEVT